jgi:hypothetical protein
LLNWGNGSGEIVSVQVAVQRSYTPLDCVGARCSRADRLK